MKYGFQIGLAVLLLASGAPAEAHPFHTPGSEFSSGFTHPFSGWDHLLAMTALGAWLGLNNGRVKVLVALAAWCMALGAGFVLGLLGAHLPLVEPGILATVLALGLLAATAVQFPAAIIAPMLVAFATFHGHAHGTEAPLGASVLYAAGFIGASAVIISTSYLLIRRIPETRREASVRGLGAAIIAAAAVLGFAT